MPLSCFYCFCKKWKFIPVNDSITKVECLVKWWNLHSGSKVVFISTQMSSVKLNMIIVINPTVRMEKGNVGGWGGGLPTNDWLNNVDQLLQHCQYWANEWREINDEPWNFNIESRIHSLNLKFHLKSWLNFFFSTNFSI